MSLNDILSTLQQEAQRTGQVTLDDALLGSGTAFAEMVQTSLRRQEGNLIFTAQAGTIPATSPPPTNTSFSFLAGVPTNSADSFLNLRGNATMVTISMVNNVAQVQVDVQLTVLQAGGTTPWVFSQSFPELLGWSFDLLPLSNQLFTIVFAPQQVPDGLSEGLNFSAPFTLTNILGPVQALLALYGETAVQQPLAGVLAPSAQGVTFALEGSLGIPAMDLTALIINAPYIRAYMNYARPRGSSGAYEPMGQVAIGATTSLVNSAGTSINLDVFFDLPAQTTTSVLTLNINPVDSTSTSLSNIGSWMAGQSWDDFFASPSASQLLPFLDTFGLLGYSLTLSLNSVSILSTSLTVGTLSTWVISEGKLEVPTFYVTWMLIDPFGAFSNTLSLSGQLDMFGSTEGEQLIFTGSLLLPNLQLSLALASPNPMTAGEWLDTIVTAFGGEPVSQDVLTAMESFSIQNIAFWMDVEAEAMSYSMAGSLAIGTQDVAFQVDMDLALMPNVVYDIKASFYLAGNLFTGEITNQNSKTVLSVTWSNPTNPVTINNIADSLGYPDLGIPPELDLNLQGIGLVYDFTDTVFVIGANSSTYGKADIALFKPTSSESYLLFAGLDVDRTLDLTNLPLVGEALSKLETVEINNLQVLIASQPLVAATDGAIISQVNALILKLGTGYPQIPAQGMASSVNVSMTLSLGTYVIPLGIGVGGSSGTNMPPAKSSVQGTPSGDANAAVPSTPGAASDGTTWFNVQKSIGPLTFKRIGVKYQEAVLWFALDATFSSGGLTLDLLDMAIGSPLSSFEPHFSLQGIGIDFKEPGLEIGGTFLKVPSQPGVDWEYAGGAIIKAAGFSLAAFGDYASMNGTPSMFLFGQVTGTFGGPPAFFVTGLAAGFGYNSSLRIPAFDQVYNFPLLTIAQEGKTVTPAQVLTSLLGTGGQQAWITHEVGQYWLAAGIQFTTYTVVSSNVMLIGEFGKHMQFALLGLSRARFPQAGPVTYAFY